MNEKWWIPWLMLLPYFSLLYLSAQESYSNIAVQLEISGDFPPDRIYPKWATLNGKEIVDDTFVPGKYRLQIQHPGYFSLDETIEIPANQTAFVIKRALRAKPITIQVRLHYDVEPQPDSQCTITYKAVDDKLDKQYSLKTGDQLVPGVYQLAIVQKGYETIDQKWFLWPQEEPFVIEKELVAKPVLILLNLVYDAVPTQDRPHLQVILIDKQTNIAHLILPENKIKPGAYLLDIVCPGYDFGERKEITIFPTDQPFVIGYKLWVKPATHSPNNARSIAWQAIAEQEMVKLYKVVHSQTAKEITVQDQFLPGQEIECQVLLKRYKTVNMRIHISPGAGYFEVEVPLVQLEKIEFSIMQKGIILDGISYPYLFYSEGELVETHQIQIMQVVEQRNVVTLWVYCEKGVWLPALKVSGGYLFNETARNRIVPLSYSSSSLRRISIPQLIEHLERVANRDEMKHLKSLEVIEKLYTRSALKQNPANEIQSLIQYVRNWQFTDASDRQRQKAIVDYWESCIK